MEKKVGQDMAVSYAYRLYDEADGELLFEATSDRPDTMIYGVTPGVVPGLEAAMKGLGPGDRFEVVLPPEAGFGMREENLEMTLDKNIFMRDGKIAEEVEEGAMLPMMTGDGQRVMGTVKAITPDSVIMDFNHPFAGRTVKFAGEIIDVREATDDEKAQARGCGGGCGGCGEGGGDCGSGNCCGGCH